MKLSTHLAALQALLKRMDPNDERDAVAIPRLEQCIEQCKADIAYEQSLDKS